jgi:hypothetical protein
MFSLGTYWKDSRQGALIQNNDDAADLMRRELGIEKRHYAAKRALEVLEDPKAALKQYKDDLDEISVNISGQFKKDLNDLLEAGYSPVQAERFALNKSEGWMQHQMAILDKKYPLVNDEALLRDTVAQRSVVRVEGKVKKAVKSAGKSKARGRSTTPKRLSAVTQSISGSQVPQGETM